MSHIFQFSKSHKKSGFGVHWTQHKSFQITGKHFKACRWRLILREWNFFYQYEMKQLACIFNGKIVYKKNHVNATLQPILYQLLPYFNFLQLLSSNYHRILGSINLSCLDPEWREKINLNFYFRTSLWCIKRLYEGRKDRKTFLRHHKEVWK